MLVFAGLERKFYKMELEKGLNLGRQVKCEKSQPVSHK
jgi:hypothetical protein